MPRVECNGAELYYEKYGNGTPVVFLHGVTMGSRFFHQQRTSLPEGFQAILLDFRGHDRSEKTQTGHTLPEYARDLRALFDELDLTDVVPVGWSMGALVLWEYVKQFGTEDLQELWLLISMPPISSATATNTDSWTQKNFTTSS